MVLYEAPSHWGKAFNCPHCQSFAHQVWSRVYIVIESGIYSEVESLKIGTCQQCDEVSIWHTGTMIHPEDSPVPMPNPDLPDDIKADYMEARLVVSKSPRGAAALLRLCIQKLCKHLKQSGDNLNDDIANLVKEGLSVKVQKALDIVRVIGNNAVHPGQIELKDNIETANGLFKLVNLIVQAMITQPNEVDQWYKELPDDSRKAIEARDRKGETRS